VAYFFSDTGITMKIFYTTIFICSIVLSGCTSPDKKPTGESVPDSTFEATPDRTSQSEADTTDAAYKPAPDSIPH
jgi:hypothetical protein